MSQRRPAVAYEYVPALCELDLTDGVISMDYTGDGSPAFRYDARTYGSEVGFTFHF